MGEELLHKGWLKKLPFGSEGKSLSSLRQSVRKYTGKQSWKTRCFELRRCLNTRFARLLYYDSNGPTNESLGSISLPSNSAVIHECKEVHRGQEWAVLINDGFKSFVVAADTAGSRQSWLTAFENAGLAVERSTPRQEDSNVERKRAHSPKPTKKYRDLPRPPGGMSEFDLLLDRIEVLVHSNSASIGQIRRLGGIYNGACKGMRLRGGSGSGVGVPLPPSPGPPRWSRKPSAEDRTVGPQNHFRTLPVGPSFSVSNLQHSGSERSLPGCPPMFRRNSNSLDRSSSSERSLSLSGNLNPPLLDRPASPPAWQGPLTARPRLSRAFSSGVL